MERKANPETPTLCSRPGLAREGFVGGRGEGWFLFLSKRVLELGLGRRLGKLCMDVMTWSIRAVETMKIQG